MCTTTQPVNLWLYCLYSISKETQIHPSYCTWKLRDPAVSKDFQDTFKDKVAALTPVESADDVEDVWSKLKTLLLETASEVCGLSKKHQWKRETCLWDDKVEEAVKKKWECFKRHIALAKAGQTRDAEDAKAAYNKAKRLAKRVVWQAKSVDEREKFSNIAPNDTGIFELAKQMDKTNQDVVGEKCVRNDAGELSLSDEEKMKAWVEHYARLLNVEFEWDSNLLPEVTPVEGPPPPVTKDLIRKVLRKMKCGKAAGPSGIIVEMLKAAGEVGIELLTELTEVVFCNGVIPTDWQESFILNLYKGKGDALECGNYRGLKLTDQVMKLFERVLDSFVREMVDIDAMQFGFVPGRGTTDAIFIIRQLQEKYISANKPLYFAFVDLEKASVGLEEFGSGGVGCTCHPGHVYGCQKGCPCQRSVQQGVRGWSWCASGICSQPLAFHTCAGRSVAPVPYWCAMGASVCWRPCCNGRLTWRMHCKVKGIERGYGKQGIESQHEEDKAHGLGTGAWPSSRLWSVPLCSLSEWCWCSLYPVLAVHVLGAQEVQWC